MPVRLKVTLQSRREMKRGMILARLIEVL